MFFALLFTVTAFLFKNAFSIYFFSDDFFFLKISRINSINQFLNFFSPFKDYFYRPLTTEAFYSFIHLLRENIFLSHSLVFIVYFVGLYYLYRIVFLLSKNKILSYLTTGFYAINFIHVFQLYFFGTFQEVAVFTFLAISFYYFLKEKSVVSLIFFIFACMSKEIATLFPIFLVLIGLINKKIFEKKRILLLYFFISVIFLLIYKIGISGVMTLDIYKIQLKPRLGINNLMWYSLWSLGFPNFMPDYFTSIFRKPIPEFWKVLKNNEIKIYFLIIGVYLSSLLLSVIVFLKNNKKKLLTIIFHLVILILAFVLFISPTLFIIHKWMVRLTLSLIFVIFIQAYLITDLIKSGKQMRLLGNILIIIYVLSNVLGIFVHESLSTFLLESHYTINAKKYFEKNQQEILKRSSIYFIDSTNIEYNPWGGSKKLKVTLSDQSFIDLYFPGANIKAIYSFENNIKPKNSFVVKSIDILMGQ